MLKRRLDSSSSESKIVKKSKPRASTSAEDEFESVNLPSSKRATTSKRSPQKNSRQHANKKTDSSRKPSSRSNNILSYLQSCPAVASKSNSARGEKIVDRKGSAGKDYDRTDTPNYCPKCQIPLKSLDCKQVHEHVWLCIERAIEFEGPCPKGLLCKEESSDHFETYSHHHLAENRSTKRSHCKANSDFSKESCSTQRNDNVDTCTYTGINNQSSNRMEIQTSEHSTHKNTLSEEDDRGSIHLDQETNDKEDDDDDDDELLANLVNSDNMDTAAENAGDSIPLFPSINDKNDDHLCTGNNDNDVEIVANLVSTANMETASRNDNVPLNSEVDDKIDIYFCSGDNDDDDKMLANLVNSENMDTVAPKDSLSQNKCTPGNIIASSVILGDKKTSCPCPSSNKYSSDQLTIKRCSIQANSNEATKCTQSDIGTYFGLKPLPKLMDQDTQCQQSKIQQNFTSNNEGFDTDSTLDVGAIGGYGARKKCPFYKRIPGTPFVVDAFHYGTIPGIKAYFLSHFHYDHYQGLTRRFSHPIFCTKITGNLVKSKLKVDPRFIKELPLNVPSPVDKVQVTLLEANHCPGAVLFLFELPTGETYLHTGDFRASPSMEEYTLLRNKHINTLFLDTTYCDPGYSFPSQDEAVQFAVRKSLQAKQKNPKTLIVCGTYTIGKEKVFLAIAEALNCKVSVTREKKRILDCLESERVSEIITLDWNVGGVHVFCMNDLKPKTLEDHLNKYNKSFTEVLAFKPTGWVHNNNSLNAIRPRTSGRVTIYGVPYSEHSSYKELEHFVKFFQPDKVIPTVNVCSREQTGIINGWLARKKY